MPPGESPSSALPSPVRAVVFDFDGVFTDNRVYVFEDGREAVVCDRSDGMGVGLLRAAGIPMLVISTEQNPVVSARCRKLDLPFRQGVDDKLSVLREWLDEQGASLADAVYVGNDVNDVECLEAVGCGVAVADAYDEAREAAAIVTRRPGGHGAVRELASLILQANHGA
jgi:YrbI family 3-deoxy-D-manno-octulosonate 8-phosphate phosphatase